MLNRRDFTGLLGGAMAAAALPAPAMAQTAIPFYASTGPKLTLYGLDVAAAVADAARQHHPARQYPICLAASVAEISLCRRQQHPAGLRPHGPAGADKNHYAIALRVGAGRRADASMARAGCCRRARCMSPPIMPAISCSSPTMSPAMVTVHRLEADGTHRRRGGADRKPDFGIYAHQVRVTPGDKTLILCSRGNDAANGKPEDPGHIEVFGFKDGQLANLQIHQARRQRAGLRAAASGFSSQRPLRLSSRWSGKTALRCSD